MQYDDAASHPLGTVLMVAVTIIVCMLLLIICMGFLQIPEFRIASVPAIFVITSVVHVDDYTGAMNYDSRLIVKNVGTTTFKNAGLSAAIYRNGKPLNCVISTLNGNDFMSTVHYGVQWIGYAGVDDETWLPGEMSAIDLTDGTFRPGDTAQLDIVDKSTGEVISRHVYRVV